MNTFWLVIFLFLAFMAWRGAAAGGIRNVKGAWDYVSGLSVGFLLILALLVFGIPILITWGVPYTEQFWGSTLGSAKQGISQINLPRFPAPADDPYTFSFPEPATPTAVSPLSVPSSTYQEPQTLTIEQMGEEQYTVQKGDTLKKVADQFGVTVDEIVQANGLSNPNSIMVGQILIVPTMIEIQITTTPMPEPPTPEPTAVAAVPGRGGGELESTLAQISQYKLDGRIDEASGLVDGILADDPQNQTALQIKREIADARHLRGLWADEAIANVVGLVPSHEDVQALLAGYSFVIEEYDNKFLLTTRDELMTIRCTTPGFMYGARVTLLASYVTRMGGDKVGDEFTVNGGW